MPKTACRQLPGNGRVDDKLLATQLKNEASFWVSPAAVVAIARTWELLGDAEAAKGRARARQAADCYQQAASLYRASGMSTAWAQAEHKLGQAFVNLSGASKEAAADLGRAIEHFGKALAVSTRKDRPCDYARTQFARGQAYLRWTVLEPVRFIMEAGDCFREAERTFRQCGEAGQAERAAAMQMRLSMLFC